MNYRKIWIQANGPIPLDDQGRSYEIHHIDGDRKNNRLENLQCLSIEAHYELHYSKGEYFASLYVLDLQKFQKSNTFRIGKLNEVIFLKKYRIFFPFF